ncbi:hypothetical protein D9758_000147 [Tetrapyrgos nigripes]|uniref:(S)-2-hydroxy-acid oxidase n=1 Tax=Tetrapyrgos nigripes TaxID=182062 RepID=A0A8H5H1A8_9AGAR|nr:hypothetical protein D9758_000147 [Tetrapyrgos nigripes]
MAWTLEQVAEHNSPSSCWVIINDRVYDVSDFLSEHPGGANIILKYAGRDATLAYEPIHPKNALEKNLPPSKHLGQLDSGSSSTLKKAKENRKKTKDELRVEQALKQRPPLHRILSLADMEDVARRTLSYKALSYYSSAADDEISTYAVILEDKILLQRTSYATRLQDKRFYNNPGHQTSIPVFVSGAALAKLGHPAGEANITRGAAKSNIIQMVSSNASLSYEEIAQAASPSQTIFFQLYKHENDAIAEKRVKDVEKLGYKAIWLTVDAIVPGNRQRDIKSPWVLEEQEQPPKYYIEGEGVADQANSLGTAGALIVNDDRDMTWNRTIPWLRRVTKLPVVVKGIQCVEDAVLAAEAGVDGILISNHGGRQLEYAMPPLEILYKLRRQHPEVFDKVEVYIDGGVRRGTDILKALCLGAKAVGMGRPFLYAQSAYGEIGVVKIVEILKRELTTAMALLGASDVRALTPDMVERVDWQPIVRSKL